MSDDDQIESRTLSFSISTESCNTEGARIGTLVTSNGRPIATPHYVAISSRGVVPHLTHDLLSKQHDVPAVYAALEDCKCAVVTQKPPLLY